MSEFNKISPLIETPGIDNLIILGAPVGNLAISNALSDKIADLERMFLRLKNIEAHHAFFPLKGGCGPQTLKFLKTLGRKLNETTQEPKSSFYMKQRIYIAIQVENAASVLGTLGDSDALSDVYYFLK